MAGSTSKVSLQLTMVLGTTPYLVCGRYAGQIDVDIVVRAEGSGYGYLLRNRAIRDRKGQLEIKIARRAVTAASV